MNLSKIVDVDYVWGEKSLIDLLETEAPLDYVIASHVIEHVPDFIGWLSEVRGILKPGGILSLAIPDKRQCLD
ncbi:MAG: class I SAM-dependent methyltransferase [Phormidesmis sp. CAN_BIN44]|nr:class I SAM-dependent methyltransferase [Phormidesmis sp. CAN_BIN44]